VDLYIPVVNTSSATSWLTGLSTGTPFILYSARTRTNTRTRVNNTCLWHCVVYNCPFTLQAIVLWVTTRIGTSSKLKTSILCECDTYRAIFGLTNVLMLMISRPTSRSLVVTLYLLQPPNTKRSNIFAGLLCWKSKFSNYICIFFRDVLVP
jgi:hypothetical protein